MKTTHLRSGLLLSVTRAGIGLLVAFLALSNAVGALAVELPCSDCHNPSGIPAPHDAGCRNTSCLATCHPKHIGLIQHPWGAGSPLTNDPAKRTEMCNTCHNRPFDGVYHPYRINVRAQSPTVAGLVDLDDACGQCHGGGTNGTDYPPRPGAPYLTKVELGQYAARMHNDLPSVNFGYGVAVPNSLSIDVAAQAICTAGCDWYDWDWGDGTAHSSGPQLPSTVHQYARPGIYAVTLTVTDNGVGRGSKTKNVSVRSFDLPPTVGGTLNVAASAWTASLADGSTDDKNVALVQVDWGDGSKAATGPAGTTFNHAYDVAGDFTVTHTVTDSTGQANQKTYPVSISPFTIAGRVYAGDGTTPLASAIVTVKRGSDVVRSVVTSGTGAFSAGSLKPGTYTVDVVRTGYTFAAPALTVGVGPSQLGQVIAALVPTATPIPPTATETSTATETATGTATATVTNTPP